MAGGTLIAVDDHLMIAMETLKLRLDSQVTLVSQDLISTRSCCNMYTDLQIKPLTVTSPRYWSPGRLLPHILRRDDFKEIVLKAGVAVSIRGCDMEH
jgi:hypothetical protein